MMKIDILTLFPDMVKDSLNESIIGRGIKKGLLDINCINIRDFAENSQNRVDDAPYGGGMGMVLQAAPLYRCWSDTCEKNGGHIHTILMSPQGKTFTQRDAIRFKDLGHIMLVCGHYEGIDERFIEECVDEEISIGDFVLTGGEIAAMAISDAVCRLVPGVLSDSICFEEESHYNGLLEYPHYTHPAEWHGKEVPSVLLSGHHANIAKWRHRKSLENTLLKRPDMLKKADLCKKDLEILDELKKEHNICD